MSVTAAHEVRPFVRFINQYRLTKEPLKAKHFLERVKYFQSNILGSTRTASRSSRRSKRRRIEKTANRQRGGDDNERTSTKDEAPFGPTKFDGLFSFETLAKAQRRYEAWRRRSSTKASVSGASSSSSAGKEEEPGASMRSILPMIASTAAGYADMVMFPLYHLEQVPVIGPVVIGGSMDLLSILLNNIGIVMNFLGPVLPVVAQVIAEVGAAIPIPGVNTVFAAAGLGLTLGSEPLEYVLTHLTQWLMMFVYIARKQWKLAYMIALEALPVFGDVMDSLVLYLSLTNKYLQKASSSLVYLADNLEFVKSVVGPIMENPSMLFQPIELLKHAHTVLPSNAMVGQFWDGYQRLVAFTGLI
jgi:hypothetical protein